MNNQSPQRASESSWSDTTQLVKRALATMRATARTWEQVRHRAYKSLDADTISKAEAGLVRCELECSRLEQMLAGCTHRLPRTVTEVRTLHLVDPARTGGWTSEAPAQAGYYWMREVDDPDTAQVVDIGPGGTCIAYIGTEDVTSALPGMEFWSKPLASPR
jgi:hypothetical protein